MKNKQHFDPHDGKQTSSELDFIYCPKCSAKLVKKVFEETGLKIKITSLVNVSSNQINPNLHTIVIVLTAEIIGGTPRAGDDLVELEWIDKSTTLPVMAFEADKIIIKRYFENALIRIPMDRL